MSAYNTSLPAVSPPDPRPLPSPMMPTTFEAAIRLAEVMSTGKLLPVHLQNKPGDCLMVIEQAMRWGMSPFAVAQATSVISGKLMFEGKLVAAAVHGSGILSGRLTYEFTGEGASRAIVCTGTLKGENKPRDFSMTLAEGKTANGMWTKQPDQQLVYASTRGWARRHTPEVMLGVYSPEEMETAQPQGDYIDAEPAKPVEPAPSFDLNPKADAHSEAAARLIARINDAPDIAAVYAIIDDAGIQKWRKAMKEKRPLIADDIDDALTVARTKLAQAVPVSDVPEELPA